MTKTGSTASPSAEGQHVRLTLADYLKILSMIIVAMWFLFEVAMSVRADLAALTSKVDSQAAELVYLRQRIDSLSSD